MKHYRQVEGERDQAERDTLLGSKISFHGGQVTRYNYKKIIFLLCAFVIFIFMIIYIRGNHKDIDFESLLKAKNNELLYLKSVLQNDFEDIIAFKSILKEKDVEIKNLKSELHSQDLIIDFPYRPQSSLIFPINKTNGYFSTVNEETVDRIFINVGLKNTFDKMDKYLTENSLLIGMEPDPKSYFELLSKENLPWSQIMLMPIAINNVKETTTETFHISQSPWCNSLSKTNKNSEFAENCKTQIRNVTVPIFNLSTILKAVPFVTWLKIDAQGLDYNVILSASEEIRKAQRVSAEMQDLDRGDPNFLYEASVPKKEVVKKMKELGFSYVICENNQAPEWEKVKENNCEFRQKFNTSIMSIRKKNAELGLIDILD